MTKFVSGEEIGVTVEGDPNTIYIKGKLNYGEKARLTQRMDTEAVAPNGKGQEDQYYIGLMNLLLLEFNIMRWEGPEFDGVPVTRENIEKLDPDDPLFDAVLGRIRERNIKPKDNNPLPNLRTTGQSAPSKRAKAR